MWKWFKDAFGWLIEQLISLASWLITSVYNLIIDVVVFIFGKLVDLLIAAVCRLPQWDLSEIESQLTSVIGFIDALNDLLPIYESFYCVSFIVVYYLAFSAIRLTIKLIPGIG